MHILFLDDNKFRHQKMLRNSIGFSISQAWTAQEAINLMKNHEFDLIMLDHDLDNSTNNILSDDEEDGRFVCEWMAKDGRHSKTSIVIHSLNVTGATSMEKILLNSGFKQVRYLPCAWTMIYKTEDGSADFNTNKMFSLEDYKEA